MKAGAGSAIASFARPMRATWASPMSNSCISEHPFDGSWAINPRACSLPPAGSALPPISRPWSTHATPQDWRSFWTGSRGISLTIRTDSGGLTAPPCTSTKTPNKGAISTGIRWSTISGAPRSPTSCRRTACSGSTAIAWMGCASMPSPPCFISTTAGRKAAPNPHGGREPRGDQRSALQQRAFSRYPCHHGGGGSAAWPVVHGRSTGAGLASA